LRDLGSLQALLYSVPTAHQTRTKATEEYSILGFSCSAVRDHNPNDLCS
jgi:hypothetical protein